MGFMFCDLHVLSNNPSSGDINSSNLSCLNLKLLIFCRNTAGFKKFKILEILHFHHS